MYLLTVILFMLVFPVIYIFAEIFIFKNPAGILFLTGKWFVFWAGGIRLFSGGLKQVIQPQFTARQIFEFKSDEPLIIIQELGFGNISIDLLGIITIFNSIWILPSMMVSGLFYGLAGTRHLLKKERNFLENGAMVSDLFIFLIMLICLIARL